MSLIVVERRGPIEIWTLDRAERLNALPDPDDGEAFARACHAVNADAEVRCVILTGAGRAKPPSACPPTAPCARRRTPRFSQYPNFPLVPAKARIQPAPGSTWDHPDPRLRGGEREENYRPLNWAGRFSRAAATPSAWSSVRWARACMAAVISSI